MRIGKCVQTVFYLLRPHFEISEFGILRVDGIYLSKNFKNGSTKRDGCSDDDEKILVPKGKCFI